MVLAFHINQIYFKILKISINISNLIMLIDEANTHSLQQNNVIFEWESSMQIMLKIFIAP